jgi:hypothetical protein
VYVPDVTVTRGVSADVYAGVGVGALVTEAAGVRARRVDQTRPWHDETRVAQHNHPYRKAAGLLQCSRMARLPLK